MKDLNEIFKRPCKICKLITGDENIHSHKCYIHKWTGLIFDSNFGALDPKKAFNVGKGWHALIDELLFSLFRLEWDGRISQVKEKFGKLRFYIDTAKQDSVEVYNKLYDEINKAEELSGTICENCGKKGKLKKTSTGWMKTLCDEHESCRDD